MKMDKETGARAGVIWAIIGVVVSTLLVIAAFTIDELNRETKMIALILFGISLAGLVMNLKVKKS